MYSHTRAFCGDIFNVSLSDILLYCIICKHMLYSWEDALDEWGSCGFGKKKKKFHLLSISNLPHAESTVTQLSLLVRSFCASPASEDSQTIIAATSKKGQHVLNRKRRICSGLFLQSAFRSERNYFFLSHIHYVYVNVEFDNHWWS